MKCPCHQCTERTATCHTTCPKYPAWVKQEEEKKAEIARQKSAENDYKRCRSFHK